MTSQTKPSNSYKLADQQVVILAGGLGTRLRPITEKIPKALVEVNGKPYLQWQFEYLISCEFKKVLLLCSHLGEQIQAHFGDHFESLSLDYSFEKPEPMGTGGALKLALPKLEETFWLLNGDSFLKVHFSQMWSEFQSGEFEVMLSAFRKMDSTVVPANLKITNMTGCHATVKDYRKGAGLESGFNAVDSGVYILTRRIIESAPPGKFQLEDLWPSLIADKRLGAYFENENFYDIGTPDRLKTFEDWLRDNF